MTSEVSCAPWQDLLLGSATTSSAAYDECSLDTVVISTNAVTASGATSDNQEIVYQELCGDGQLIAKVSALSGGYAGLFVRESNAAGARKGAIMTQKGSTVFRHLRSATGGLQLQASYMASGHQWLKINRSGTQVIGSWSTNGTSWNVAFNTALSMTDCVVIGMAAFSTSSGTTINATFTNISVAQADTIPSTTVSFADSSLTAQGGDTVQICVNLQNPCYCSPVTVDVALATDSLPHLIGYEPQTLTFEEGDTVQCFTVVLEESDSSGTYTFELTNLEGGNDSEIGVIGALVLEVDGNEEEAYGLCGSFNRSSPSTVDSTEMSFYDRFGNLYLLEELLIPSGGGGGCGCDEFEGDIPYQDENYFMLYFEDCVTPPSTDDKGFADPTYGTERRRAACRAFAQLAHLIQRSEDPCNEGVLPTVNIKVLTSGNDNLPSGVLAAATPFYDYLILQVVPAGGIIDGLPWKIINNGGYVIPQNLTLITGTGSTPYNGFHGSFIVNFEDFGFYTGDAFPSNTEDNFYDLYHTTLHEALHILGFVSLIQPDDGAYKLPLTKSYGRFDTHLRLSTGSPVIVRDGSDPYKWNLNIDPEDLHKSCQNAGGVTGPDMWFYSGASFPIHTGPPGTLPGIAFSHLNNYCDGATDEYLMNFDIEPETRIELGVAEKSILCGLGYRVLGEEDCSCTVAGGHDLSQACSAQPIKLDLCEGNVFILPYSLLLGNDTDADGIDHLILTQGFAEVEDLENGTIRLTSCGANPGPISNSISLIYTPISSTCVHEGSPLRVNIEIHPCVGCENFLSDTPLPENSNSCNLVCNPEIIAYTPEGEQVEENISAVNCFSLICHELPGWYGATITPDYFLSPNVSGNSGSLSFLSENSTIESAFTPLSLEEGQYFFSFYGSASKTFGMQPEGTFTLKARLVSPEITSQFQICSSIEASSEDDFDLMEGDILTIGELDVLYSSPPELSRGAFCFDIPDNNTYNALWFYPTTETEYRVRSYIDNIEVIPDNFGLAEDLTLDFGCSADLGEAFCMLSNVTILYEWFEEVDNTLVPILAYTVLNGVATPEDEEDPDNDDFNFDTHVFTVTPEQTTTYVLQRSIVTPNDLPEAFELCSTEDEIVVTVTEEPEFTLVSEACGLATFSITGLEPGDDWEIDFGEDDIPASSFLSHFYLTSGNYTATVTITRECGAVLEYEVEVEAELCFECEDCNSGNTIGETGGSTLLSDVITSLSLHPYFDEVNLCVAGTLVINTSYNFSNSFFRMQPGARILIPEHLSLSIENSLLTGCEEMWRGIELKQDAKLKMSGCTVLDAQYAVYLHPAENAFELTGGTVVNNTFGNNFVGLIVPQTPTGRINVALGDNFYYQSGSDLKHPYTTQTSAPESLPAQDDHALAGIIVNNQGGFGSYRNRFLGLTAGIVASRTGLIVKENRFTSIQPYPGEYPNFIGRGMGIRSDANGAVTTLAAENRFTNCFVGISANLTALTAIGNTLTDVYGGIFASLPMANNANIKIEDNNIENATFAGIMVAHANPNGAVSISRNKVSTDAEANGVGIWLLSNNAPAIVEGNNPVTVKGAGIGIGIQVSSRTELKDNIVKLDNTDAVRAGIALAYVQRTALRNNTVEGFGITGDANENIGLEIASSPGNAYCCNTLDNTRLGVSVFGGSLTTDQFRGTTFGAHAYSLYLPNANAVLGSQTHTENCWQGNSGAAMYGVTQEYAQNYRFLVDEMANSCFSPPSYSPEGWFQNLPNSNLEVVCSSEICKTTNFKPDSDDVKRLTDGDTILLPAVRWELQRYLYEKLLTEAPGDTTNEKFRDNVENTTIGFFQAINESIAAMLAADSLSRAALNANLILASGKLDSLILIDSLVTIEEDSSEIAGLMQTRGGLTDVLFDLALDNETLAEEISDNFLDAADDLRAVNDTITVVEDFEINEKVVNDLYLAYLAEADTSEMDTLEAIAIQCPLLGGNAVYRARALLAMMTGELASYNDSLACASVQALSLPHGHHTSYQVATDLTIFPNPANGEVNIRWKTAPQKPGQIQITDLYGQQVRQMIIVPGATEIKMPAGYLPDGMYFFRIRLDNLETTRKLIIQH